MNPNLLLKAKRPQRIDNPLYPLPADYSLLTREGQREARLNAMCLQETSEDYVNAWHFFRTYYLGHEEAYWYDMHVDSPPFHFEVVESLFRSKSVAVAAPRGFSKSTIMEECLLLEALTRPGSKLRIVKATHEMIRDMMDSFKTQFSDNHRIIDDFGVMQPPRGKGRWSDKTLRLTNFTQIQGGGITSKQRGGRAHRLFLDDVEHDPKPNTDRESLTREFLRLFGRVYMPMLKKGCSIAMICTLLERDTFSYHILTTKDDMRFAAPGVWDRRVYAAINPDGSLLWPEAFPWDFLKEQEIRMGTHAWRAEFMNDPGAPEDSLFEINEDTQYNLKFEGYDGPLSDEETTTVLAEPFECNVPVVYNEVTRKVLTPGAADATRARREVPYNDLLNNMYRFITVDYAHTTLPESDFSCVHVLGCDKRNDIWSLDMWLGKKSEAEIIKEIWRLAQRWQVRLVAIEAPSIHLSFVTQVALERERLLSQGQHVPRVLPIKPKANIDKPTKIASLEWRFNGGKIKLPAWRKHVWPYKELYFQIQNFSPNFHSLPKDDAIDTLQLAQEVIKSKRHAGPSVAREKTVYEKLLDDDPYIEGTKIPVASPQDIMAMPPEVMAKMMEKRYLSLAKQWQEHQEGPTDEDVELGALMGRPAADLGAMDYGLTDDEPW